MAQKSGSSRILLIVAVVLILLASGMVAYRSFSAPTTELMKAPITDNDANRREDPPENSQGDGSGT